MASWEQFGEVANVVQLSGLNAAALIGLIVKTASNVRMHKKNCRQFAQHVKLIGNVLEQLRISDLKKYPECREPLEQLEDALRRAYLLVNNCKDKSYLYLVAMGWNIVYQFRIAQEEIDRYLKIIPLIALLDNARFKERLEEIQKDHREYTFDEEDRKVQVAISANDAIALKKSISFSYPNLPFDKAMQKEQEKLKAELQNSQVNMDVDQCKVIEHLIEVTAIATDSVRKESPPHKNTYMESDEEPVSCDENPRKIEKLASSSKPAYSGYEVASSGEKFWHEEWHTDLLGCCSEPCLCVKTLLCPCDTLSKVASMATGKRISSAEACNNIMAYSLILSCCCYTCCIRRKLRHRLNIEGGFLDDFLSHFMCCCCALVQEWREVRIRGVYGSNNTVTAPPISQHMEGD